MSKTSTPPPQGSLMLRILAGGYLVYTAWEMRDAFADGILFIIPAVLFALIGAALVIFSVRSLVLNDYFKKTPMEELNPEETELIEDREESSNE